MVVTEGARRDVMVRVEGATEWGRHDEGASPQISGLSFC